MVDLANKIKHSIDKFGLNLKNKIVLTEAATGNYVVTPVIATLSGAKKVYALTAESKYGTVKEVEQETFKLSKIFGNDIANKIEVITSLDNIDLSSIDILTNTGFLRPINKSIINQLSSTCVIPLMWETWEFRDTDLDLDACNKKNIKIYGTNEDDERLRTKEYIGYMALKFLLNLNHTPLSSNILVLGCDYFNIYIEKILNQNRFKYKIINTYENKIDISEYNAIILVEHHKKNLLIGENGFIDIRDIPQNVDVIHICGNVDLLKAKFNYIPNRPAKFGYMSFTADYMGSQVVIDLHTAGLKVAEGMIKANSMKLPKDEYKKFMEKNYPAMAFDNERYW